MRERTSYAAANARYNVDIISEETIKSAPNTFHIVFCDCLLYFVNGNVPCKKTLIQRHKKSLKKFSKFYTKLINFDFRRNCRINRILIFFYGTNNIGFANVFEILLVTVVDFGNIIAAADKGKSRSR